GTDTCLVGRAAAFDVADHGTHGLGQTNGLGHVFGHVADLYADATPRDLAVFFELLDHLHGLVDGNGQRDAHEPATARDDLRVHAHHTAREVDERATRVAGVHRHVGLDEGQVVAGFPIDGADDTGRHRGFEPERRTDGEHPLPLAQRTRFADRQGLETLGLDFHQRQVGALVGAHDLGLVFLAVVQGDENIAGTGHHVIVGENVAVAGNEEPGTDTTRNRALLGFGRFALTRLAGHRGQEIGAKKPAEHLVRIGGPRPHAIAHPDGFSGANVDHRRLGLFNDLLFVFKQKTAYEVFT